MKDFDAVKTMREIRTILSERYKKDANQQTEDLRRIHEKYHIQLSQPVTKKSKVAEDGVKYGGDDHS
jgi:hypothetical protein